MPKLSSRVHDTAPLIPGDPMGIGPEVAAGSSEITASRLFLWRCEACSRDGSLPRSPSVPSTNSQS